MDSTVIQHKHLVDLQVQILIARLCLHAGRFKDALDIYTRLLSENPNEIDVLFILANLYLLSGYGRTAEGLYAQILPMVSANNHTARQFELARDLVARGQVETEVELFPDQPEAVARLVQRLEALDAQSPAGERVRQAADDLERVMVPAAGTVELANPAGLGADELLPALIELNLKQARAADRSDLADVLVSLQLSLRKVNESDRANP